MLKTLEKCWRRKKLDSDARKGLSYFVDSMSVKFPKEIKVIWLLSSSEMAEKTVAIVLDGDLEKIKKKHMN